MANDLALNPVERLKKLQIGAPDRCLPPFYIFYLRLVIRNACLLPFYTFRRDDRNRFKTGLQVRTWI